MPIFHNLYLQPKCFLVFQRLVVKLADCIHSHFLYLAENDLHSFLSRKYLQGGQVFTVFHHLTVKCSKTSQDKKAIPDYQTP